ncbi:hypothetical protein F7725_006446 [Dissostichus mawsoni]|uniref:Uncharacterized protein n=1 Tax=Dissostichus mawsoni TaxID=36200 RepID=A0A7J5XTX4_DISMA|nr:hypothetical protein F7725_006446 [Dissostichus mawsoni]
MSSVMWISSSLRLLKVESSRRMLLSAGLHPLPYPPPTLIPPTQTRVGIPTASSLTLTHWDVGDCPDQSPADTPTPPSPNPNHPHLTLTLIPTPWDPSKVCTPHALTILHLRTLTLTTTPHLTLSLIPTPWDPSKVGTTHPLTILHLRTLTLTIPHLTLTQLPSHSLCLHLLPHHHRIPPDCQK